MTDWAGREGIDTVMLLQLQWPSIAMVLSGGFWRPVMCSLGIQCLKGDSGRYITW